MTRLQHTSFVSSSRSGAGSTAIPPITQEELEHYRELAALVREQKALRQDFLDRLAAGATVETGNLILSVRLSESRRLTQTSLQSILTSDEIKQLKSQVEPSTSVVLMVKASQDRDLHSNELIQTPLFFEV